MGEQGHLAKQKAKDRLRAVVEASFKALSKSKREKLWMLAVLAEGTPSPLELLRNLWDISVRALEIHWDFALEFERTSVAISWSLCFGEIIEKIRSRACDSALAGHPEPSMVSMFFVSLLAWLESLDMRRGKVSGKRDLLSRRER